MIPILQVFYSVFSGAILAAAIPNEIYLFGAPVFTLIALVPFYFVFRKIKNYREAFIFGFIQTTTTHLISSFWLAFKEYAVLTYGFSALASGLIGGFLSLFLYLPYSSSKYHNSLNENSIANNFVDSIPFRVLYFSAIYTIYEWVKSSGFLGYPWGTVSSAIFKWPLLMQLSSVTGTWGVTFYIAAFNAILAEVILLYFDSTCIIKKEKHSQLVMISKLFAVFSIFIFIHGLYQYNKERKPQKYLNTILVQQNSDPWKLDTDDETILLSQKLTQQQINKLKENELKPELVVWSEGCLLKSFPNGKYHYQYFPSEYPLLQFINDSNTPFILGGSFVKNKEKKQYFNASLLFDEKGNYRGVYGKNHLVPFAEAIPFIEYPAMKAFMKKVANITSGWTPGDQYTYFIVPCHVTPNFKLPSVQNIDLSESYEEQTKRETSPYKVKIATPICFDDAFSDIMRPLFLNGAELFVNITDDSWSQTKSSEIQHFVIASYAAIEYRTTLVRSANAGYSVVVTPAGKIIGDLPLFEEASQFFEVPVYEHKMTTYARFGNWFVYILIILAICYILFCYFTFVPDDYIPSEVKHKKKSKKHGKKKSKK